MRVYHEKEMVVALVSGKRNFVGGQSFSGFYGGDMKRFIAVLTLLLLLPLSPVLFPGTTLRK
jgi:hypothetical protein